MTPATDTHRKRLRASIPKREPKRLDLSHGIREALGMESPWWHAPHEEGPNRKVQHPDHRERTAQEVLDGLARVK